MRIRRTIATAFALLVVAAGPATAMGSGNPYQDLQVGVTYTVYQPTFTAGLTARHVGPNLAGAPGVEQNLYAEFGKNNGRNFTIYEGNPMSSDIGAGGLVTKLTIQGQPATLVGYCPPSNNWTCTKADVGKYGGHIEVTLPAKAGLRPTKVWVETVGPKAISAQQLIKVAQGLKPLA